MCLSEVYQIFKPASRVVYYAYKVMSPGKPFRTDIMDTKLKKKKWNIDKKRGNIGNIHVFYPTGFHVWNKLRDARNYMYSDEEVWLVEITNLVAEGRYGSGEVLVAKKMRFIKKIEDEIKDEKELFKLIGITENEEAEEK